MQNLQQALGMLGAYVPPVDRLAKTLPSQWIEQALHDTGVVTVRRRRLPMPRVVWLVIGMALMRQRSIKDVVQKLDLARAGSERAVRASRAVAASATSQARGQLGYEPMKWLMQKTGSVWTQQAAKANLWQGLSVLAMDGTLLHLWDSGENREHFRRASGGGLEGGYPLARLVTVCSVRTHLTLDAQIGGYHDSEHALLRPLIDQLPQDSVTILDKNFHAVPFLWRFSRLTGQRHFLLPAKRNAVGTIVETHAKNDYIIELNVSAASRKKYPELPAALRLRAVWFRHPKTGRKSWLLTSLIDRKAYPRLSLVNLYRERWALSTRSTVSWVTMS